MDGKKHLGEMTKSRAQDGIIFIFEYDQCEGQWTMYRRVTRFIPLFWPPLLIRLVYPRVSWTHKKKCSMSRLAFCLRPLFVPFLFFFFHVLFIF